MSKSLSGPGLGFVAALGIFPAAACSFVGALIVAGDRWSSALNSSPVRAVLFGTLFALALTAALAAPARRFARAGTASSRTFGELHVRFLSLKWRLDALGVQPELAGARAQLDEAARALDEGSDGREASGWLTLSSYVELWRRLHAVEEALVGADAACAVEAAHVDLLRLGDSRIPQSDALLARGRAALGVLGASDAALLGLEPSAAPPSEETSAAARRVLATVRNAINDYRDDRRAGLAMARNRLLVTVFFTGMLGYTLLVIAVLNSGVRPYHVAAAAAFYLVGAIVGLFRELRVVARADADAGDDFGVWVARLLHRPLFSGLAALGGVVFVHVLVPDGRDVALGAVYDLRSSQVSLLTAAIFGLTPDLLLSGLTRQAERFKADLSASKPSGAAPPPLGQDGEG